MTRKPTWSLLLALAVSACGQHEGAAKACTPPRDYWQSPHFIGGLAVPIAQVTLDHSNRLYLSGKPISARQLSVELDKINKVTAPDLQVFLDTEMGADCAMLDAVRDQIDRSLNCRASGRCAEGSRTVWKEWPIPPGTPPS
jgi:hypothetical protein